MFFFFVREGFAVKIHMVFGIAQRMCFANVSDSLVNTNSDGCVVHLNGEIKISDKNGENESEDDDSDLTSLRSTSSSDDDFDLLE